jgi:hypothetical protein
VDLDYPTLKPRLVMTEISRASSEHPRVPEIRTASTVTSNPSEHNNWSCDDDKWLLRNAKLLVQERTRRQRYFEKSSFGEPLWDILLDLFVARLTGVSISISSACIASGVPSTTALRHLSQLAIGKMVIRIADPADGRRVYLELSNDVTESMKQYLRSEIGDRT